MRRRWRKAWLFTIPLVLGAVWAAWVAFLYVNQEVMIFPGKDRQMSATVPPDAEPFWLTNNDGCRVEGWYKPGRGRSATSPGPAVIYFHGNNDLLETSWWIARPNYENGISTLVVEYRGYGRCDGEPSEAALISDAVRFYDWLAERAEVDPGRIVFHGTSLGGAVAIGLATQRPPAALILECPFTSIEAIAHRYLVPAAL